MKKFLFYVVLILFSSCQKDYSKMKNLEGIWEQSDAEFNGFNAFVATRKVTLDIYNVDKNTANYTQTVRYRWNDELIYSESGLLEFIDENGVEAIDEIRGSYIMRKKFEELSLDRFKYTFEFYDDYYAITYTKQ